MSNVSQSRVTSANRRRQSAAAALTLFLILTAMLVPIPTAASAPQTHTIEVTARQFAFEPATLDIQRGDTVTLRLESLDASHGMSIDGYAVDLHAEPGKGAETTFVADKAGKFKFRCSVSCGILHPFMIGEMNVEPDFPFARAAAATVIAMLGALAYFWK
ncbi:MAG TPA: cupredoxin domain-containing protein [Anaerolineae bacterium]